MDMDMLTELDRAHREGRLWWRLTDTEGRPVNGGDETFRQPELPKDGGPSEWAPRVDDVRICVSGYHVTSAPHRWMGSHVYLVEVDEVVDRADDKAVCHTFRVWREVDPERIFRRSGIWVAAARPHLQGADLTGADLVRARLTGADLTGADLRGADLRGAGLTGADLRGANLCGAYLCGAKLTGANLRGADLQGADLYGVNLTGAADLTGADLTGANLRNTNLREADLHGTTFE